LSGPRKVRCHQITAHSEAVNPLEAIKVVSEFPDVCWGEGKDATLRSRAFADIVGPTETKRAGTPFAPYDIRRRPPTRSFHRAASSQLGGPRVIRPIVTGPAWPLRVTGLICKGIPVITVCNPALWEYSRDNLGVLGHMRP
jgi:hypothetical protein